MLTDPDQKRIVPSKAEIDLALQKLPRPYGPQTLQVQVHSQDEYKERRPGDPFLEILPQPVILVRSFAVQTCVRQPPWNDTIQEEWKWAVVSVPEFYL
jgi:hypothetical protein